MYRSRGTEMSVTCPDLGRRAAMMMESVRKDLPERRSEPNKRKVTVSVSVSTGKGGGASPGLAIAVGVQPPGSRDPGSNAPGVNGFPVSMGLKGTGVPVMGSSFKSGWNGVGVAVESGGLVTRGGGSGVAEGIGAGRVPQAAIIRSTTAEHTRNRNTGGVCGTQQRAIMLALPDCLPTFSGDGRHRPDLGTPVRSW